MLTSWTFQLLQKKLVFFFGTKSCEWKFGRQVHPDWSCELRRWLRGFHTGNLRESARIPSMDHQPHRGWYRLSLIMSCFLSFPFEGECGSSGGSSTGGSTGGSTGAVESGSVQSDNYPSDYPVNQVPYFVLLFRLSFVFLCFNVFHLFWKTWF